MSDRAAPAGGAHQALSRGRPTSAGRRRRSSPPQPGARPSTSRAISVDHPSTPATNSTVPSMPSRSTAAPRAGTRPPPRPASRPGRSAATIRDPPLDREVGLGHRAAVGLDLVGQAVAERRRRRSVRRRRRPLPRSLAQPRPHDGEPWGCGRPAATTSRPPISGRSAGSGGLDRAAHGVPRPSSARLVLERGLRR